MSGTLNQYAFKRHHFLSYVLFNEIKVTKFWYRIKDFEAITGVGYQYSFDLNLCTIVTEF